MVELRDEQQEVLDKLHNGNILVGDVGSGKSRTALAYYVRKECNGDFWSNTTKQKEMENPKDLYIITTAKKRDDLEWVAETIPFCITQKVCIDSWNNIKKYTTIQNAFFIFDEQRLVGYGSWVKSFLAIAKHNNWILLTATPGDKWMDYLPVFIANGFFKNKTEFIREHAVYDRFSKYPKINQYVHTGVLNKYRNQILVFMKSNKKTSREYEVITCDYDKDQYKIIMKDRWDIFNDYPLENIASTMYTIRKLVNSDATRWQAVSDVFEKHKKLIIFYNFDYELNTLLLLCDKLCIPVAQWNGHKHQSIPKTDEWIYLVQYMAGAEGWNCIETNAILFYSQTYSYKTQKQAEGRIDRLNTPFDILYYYKLISKAPIDQAIAKALRSKKDFNESAYFNKKV